MTDWIIVGAGLSGKLSALYLAFLNPKIKIILIEKQFELSQCHTWSCFSSDVPSSLLAFSNSLPWIGWDRHIVQFPDHKKELLIGYQSLKETNLNKALLASSNIEIKFNSLALKQNAKNEFLQELTIETHGLAQTLRSKNILWCTGWPNQISEKVGYQKFVGLEISTSLPHGIRYPIIMDACVEQTDGYRFFYVLPFSETELFIEDTYYSESSDLPVEQIKSGIHSYLKSKFQQNGFEIYQEVGVLPIPLEAPILRGAGRSLGVAGGQFHLVTGYSLPSIFKNLKNLNADLRSSPELPPRSSFLYLLLNHFMFLASPPNERWRVFSFFYRHSPELIQRFYSSAMNPVDWIRFFLKWPPPVQTRRALFIAGRFVKEMTLKLRSEKI